MTDLFTYALILIAALGWMLAVGAFSLIDRQREIIDALERRVTEVTRQATYNRRRKCQLVHENLDLHAQLQRRQREPDLVCLDSLPVQVKPVHRPSVN